MARGKHARKSALRRERERALKADAELATQQDLARRMAAAEAEQAAVTEALAGILPLLDVARPLEAELAEQRRREAAAKSARSRMRSLMNRVTKAGVADMTRLISEGNRGEEPRIDAEFVAVLIELNDTHGFSHIPREKDRFEGRRKLAERYGWGAPS